MSKVIDEIREIIDRETRAWETQDVGLLLSIFHSDMVWVWPKDNRSCNPVNWVTKLGKFNKTRWEAVYEEIFRTFRLVHNKRQIVKTLISKEADGAFAVVDVDTLWQDKEGSQEHWLGRTGKTYAKTSQGWKMIAQVGPFEAFEKR
ncbi:hypothetical protein ACFLZP_02180 [Patescibacteria group bacterium]